MLIDRFRDLLGDRVIAELSAHGAPYLADERELFQARPPVLFFPLHCGGRGDHPALQPGGLCRGSTGGNTGYCGGATLSEGQVLLNLSKLNRVRAIDPVGMTATVEAGVILAELQAAVDAEDLFFPLSMGSRGSCQLGNLATNAGGLAVLKYGMAGELVLGLEVVLADGTVMDLLKPLRKDNTGYHLTQLFLGAEGRSV